MAHAATFDRHMTLGLLALALALVCASPREARAAALAGTSNRPARLTIMVTVTDKDNAFIPSGKVTIRRTGGADKSEPLVNGVAGIRGDFLMVGDYQVIAEAEGYRQEASISLPLELLQRAATSPDKTAALDKPIVLTKLSPGEPPPELAELQRQFAEQLSKHPELLDPVLGQVEAQRDLQTRVSDQVRAGRYGWIRAVGARQRSIWDLWWLLALPVAFGLGLLTQRLLREPGAEQSAPLEQTQTTAPNNRQPPTAPNASETLEDKIGQLIQTQNTLVVKIQQLVDGGVQRAGDGNAGARAERSGVVTREHAGAYGDGSLSDQSRWLGNEVERARSCYLSLARDGRSSPAPRYLDAEVKNSPKDLVGDRQVFLVEVAHMQGAFVLFAGDRGKGWVFPNPQLNFSPALRPVYPQLTAGDFNNSKEYIDPVPAVRVEDGRWRVEQRS
ncbi:MAG TPA: carboxypeptidase-like regulatory domain-containing protein [Pyrinomonadaceae bacterium]